MRVGLSILTHSGHNIWNNGIGQNVYFLAKCLDAIPFIEKVVIINCGDQNEPPADAGHLGSSFELIRLDEALQTIDLAIEMGGALGDAWKATFRTNGGRIAFHNCGQPYAALIEPHIFGKQGCFVGPELCDEVWLLPKDRKFSAMQRAIHRCDVHEVPYLWASDFLISSGQAGADLEFGYRSGSMARGNLRPAIFEPNISPIKMGIIPLFICEEIQRRRPDLIGSVKFLNGAQMMDAKTFSCMVENLELTKASKLNLGARDYFSDVMRTGSNMVLSHQLEVTQNYVYLDALYGRYPLVHNSPDFSDAGYYYDASNVDEAVELIEWIVEHHDKEIESYSARARRKLDAVDPLSPHNRDVYARRILALMQTERSKMAQPA